MAKAVLFLCKDLGSILGLVTCVCLSVFFLALRKRIPQYKGKTKQCLIYKVVPYMPLLKGTLSFGCNSSL